MSERYRVGARAACLTACLAIVVGSGRASAQRAEGTAAAARPLTISIGPRHEAWLRDFNPFHSDARWPSVGGIHEPLLVHNAFTQAYVPWLAKSFSWEDDNTRLRFVLRDGVQWSDGEPFTAADVVFTFELMKKFPALDGYSIWEFLSDVQAASDQIVDFRFSRRYTPGLWPLSRQAIVPRHVWAKVDNPVTFANPTPVATGPFTEVVRFEPQVYELGRNPHYWQPGKPAVASVRVPLLSTNDEVLQALVSGAVDWATVFIPDVEHRFVALDPGHNQYWYPDTGSHVLLYLNTREKPFGDVRVRKALSLAIDRARIVKESLFNYTSPADVTGLPSSQRRWKDASVLAGDDWTRRDLVRARALMDEAGLPAGADGLRAPAGGAALKYDLLVVKGWTDWESAGRIIAANLRDIGITVTVRPVAWEAWSEALARGRFGLAIGQSNRGATPYEFYRTQMSSDLVRPVGEAARGNFHRFASVAADQVLRRFELVSDDAELLKLAGQLEKIYAAEAPSLPLLSGPAWGAFTTRAFVGYPTARNPYATPNPESLEALPALVEVRPR